MHMHACLHTLSATGMCSSHCLVSKEESNEDEKVEWNKVSWFRVLRLSVAEWPLLVAGVIAAGVQGAIFPSFSIFFGQALEAFTFPFNLVSPASCHWPRLHCLSPNRCLDSHTSGRGCL